MFKDLRFTYTAIRYFGSLKLGRYQRIDGVDCFSPLSSFFLWRWRLKLLVWRGIIREVRTSSIWKSCNGMPSYGLSTMGEGLIKEAQDYEFRYDRNL